jgi:hypothetical protein
MTSHSAFDYARPYDIMVGHWVGTANIFGPKGSYVMSTKSYVSIYWKEYYTILSFRESAEDCYGFQGCPEDYLDPRAADGPERISAALNSNKKLRLAASDALRVLTYDFCVKGPYCETIDQTRPVSVTGRQTRPDAYQFHVKMNKNGHYHHVYNSHHLPTPDDWHIIGPIVGRIKRKDGTEVDGEVGLAVVQNFRRISYGVPAACVRELAK